METKKPKDPKKVLQGKRNKAAGRRLEDEARAALVGAGYIICRWQNTVEFSTDYDAGGSITTGRLVGAKPKWNFFTKSLTFSGVGFPDFVVMKPLDKVGTYKVIGLEAKRNGYLDPEERDKVKWYLDNNIFQKIIIAKKDKAGHLVFMDSQTKEECLVGEIFI